MLVCKLDHSCVRMCPNSISRRRHRWQGGKTGLSSCRLFGDAIQLPYQAPHVARSEFLSTVRQTGPVRYTSRLDYLGHAGRIFGHLLFRTYRAVPRMVDGRVCHRLYDGTRVLFGS